MLYLAQVNKEATLGQIALQLLAYQTSDNTWAMIAEEKATLNTETMLHFSASSVPDSSVNAFSEGVLVLAEIADNHKILSIKSATNWVLSLVQKYLTKDITLDFLQEEAEKTEEWRQSLTLQSQKLSRRAIEIEARQEQIQSLEEKIQREKYLLEIMAAKLKSQPHQ